MSVTAADLFERAGRIIGARTGLIGTVAAGPTGYTTAVLKGLVNNTGDQTAYAGWMAFFLDSPEGSKETYVYSFTPTLGKITFLDLADAPVEGERYMLVPPQDYTLNEWRYALEKALNETMRSYRLVIPFTPLLNRFPLSQITELTGAGDIDDARATLSPLMLHNEDMSLWQNGASAAPDGYTLTGDGATVQRVSGGTRSNYAARVTSGAGALCRFTQSIPASLVQWITRRSFPVYIPMRAAAWLTTTDASSVRVFIHDGSTYHYADYTTADGVPQFPHLSVTPDADMTAFTWGVEIAAGTKSADISWAGLMQNTIDFPSNFGIKDSGSQSYPYVEFEVNKRIRNVGGLPILETPPPLPTTWGQLIVFLRRPFPAYSADDDAYDDQYARVLTAGLLVMLLQANKPNQDRARIDDIRAQQQRIWKRMSSNIQDLPVPTSTIQQNIVGA